MTKYNDFLMLSPNKMEELAKKYQQSLQHIPVPKNFFNPYSTTNYYQLLLNLNNLQHHTSSIKNLCSPKIYNQHLPTIKKIDCLLGSLNLSISQTQPPPPKDLNFCKCIKDCITITSISLTLTLNLLGENLNPTHFNHLLTLATKLSSLTPLYVTLIGDCKYRW